MKRKWFSRDFQNLVYLGTFSEKDYKYTQNYEKAFARKNFLPICKSFSFGDNSDRQRRPCVGVIFSCKIMTLQSFLWVITILTTLYVISVNWLDHAKTLREQGINTDEETLLLRRKFFFSDQNVDARDPVQLNLLFVQVGCWHNL